ncbi:MAG: hypothetical protein HRU35_07910 [Rickettsiaceae bacterium]|nr:hypothetical protein [Rickettsiaceae bacterium]
MEKFIGKYRLKQIKKAEDNAYNWLFLPGGPGIGADYLESFVTKLPLKNNLFIADFPGDGSNRNCQEVNFDLWRNGLL